MAIKEQETIEKLAKLGFKVAGEKVKRLSEKKRKLAIAYEHYRFVRQEKIDEFNKKLAKETRHKGTSGYDAWQELSFTPVEKYGEVPPAEVLEALEAAHDRNCFDSYEVAHIVTQVKLPDPILFGRINECTDRFFIAQWDDDVKIEDILSSKEG